MDTALGLSTTPYSLSKDAVDSLREDLKLIEERVALLRSTEKLTKETLQRYYGEKRFEQVAESNAIEGSTLSVGETQLAILKGITLSGHDPAYVRDARALGRAYDCLEEMAGDGAPTNVPQISKLHEIILDGRPGAGSFRRVPVVISGSEHRPPKTWEKIMTAMEDLERWSLAHANSPAIVRAAVLHAWFVHIHPFEDGNGRTARALTTLELIRAGYPPLIIRRVKERDRYIDALRTSDVGGDIGPFFDLIIERAHGALLGLERTASIVQGYDPTIQRIRLQQERRRQVWNTGVEFLFRILVERLGTRVDAVQGHLSERFFKDPLDLDDYIDLCKGHGVRSSWTFELTLEVPGVRPLKRLAWTGFRTFPMLAQLGQEQGPTLFWSVPNPAGYPPWTRAGRESPWAEELTIVGDSGDEWCVRTVQGETHRMSTSEAAARVAEGFIGLIAG